MEETIALICSLVILLLLLILFFIPTIIAFIRGHHYRWIILILNIFGSLVFGCGWIIAFIWSIWPSDTGVLDPLINDPTSNSRSSNKAIYTRYGENMRSFCEAAAPGSIETSSEGEIVPENEGGNSGPNNFCTNCGMKNEGHAKYCRNCGSKLC